MLYWNVNIIDPLLVKTLNNTSIKFEIDNKIKIYLIVLLCDRLRTMNSVDFEIGSFGLSFRRILDAQKVQNLTF